jgi:hypothetical protein
MFDYFLSPDLPEELKYKIDWLKQIDRDTRITTWLNRVADSSFRERHAIGLKRRELATEFFLVLSAYQTYLFDIKLALATGKSRCDRSKIRIQAEIDSMHVTMNQYTSLFRQKFSQDLVGGYKSSAEFTRSIREVTRVGEKMQESSARLFAIERKLQLVNYWLDDLVSGNEVLVDIDWDGNWESYEEGLFLAFLGNASSGQVIKVLDALLVDMEKIYNTPSLIKITDVCGVQHKGSYRWRPDDFKATVKVEASISAELSKTIEASASFEAKGIKGKMSAAAAAKAYAGAGFHASAGIGGISAAAEVEVEIGLRVSCNASLELGDLFLMDVSAAAFAGAMASGKVELTCTVQDGIAVAISAEAFAGIKIDGSSSVAFKFKGQELIRGTITGSFTAGIGANFNLDFRASGAGNTSFNMNMGLTIGIGGAAGAELVINSWSASEYAKQQLRGLAWGIIERLTRDEKAYHFKTEYLNDLLTNQQYFRHTIDKLNGYQRMAEQIYDNTARQDRVLALIKEIADSHIKPSHRDQKIEKPVIAATLTSA